MPSDEAGAATAEPPKKSSRVARRRLPTTIGGFSVNFCRNPRCERFGLLPHPFAVPGRTGGGADHGKISGKGEDRSYFCPSCGLAGRVKSNRAIVEEYARLRRIGRRTKKQHCETEGCANQGVSVKLSPTSYYLFGKTAKGDPRYQCKACKKTFSLGSSTRRHKRTDDTTGILKALVNKVPLSRICELHDVSMKQVHAKIDFLSEQATAFAFEREQRLAECFADRSPYFATDIQTILVNWPVKSRRGTVPLLHMATVHKFSQFVVAATVDFDPDVSPDEVEKMMTEAGDFRLPRSMRKHARLWARSEYQDTLMRSQNSRFSKDDIATAGRLELPGRGSRLRGDAFMFAHMMLVKKLIGEQFRRANYCIDAEAGLAAYVCALNVDLVKSGRVNVAEVSFKKALTNDTEPLRVCRRLIFVSYAAMGSVSRAV